MMFIKRRIRIFIAAMGPGEIAQGSAFAHYAKKMGVEIMFAVSRRAYVSIADVKSMHGKTVVTETSKSLNHAIVRYKPDVLVLCNSKIFSADGFYINHPPVPKPPTISIDSNWLFGAKSPYTSLPWVDRYCINIPKKVFRLGLKTYGGHYAISATVFKKIRIVGLLPSYPKIPIIAARKIRKKYGILQGEKLIFLYASASSLSSALHQRVFKKAIEAVRIVREKGHEIKIISAGEVPRNVSGIKEKWFMHIGKKDTVEFYTILGSSDLVVQHQGLGTLAQAISARIPVIANVRDLMYEKSPYHAHVWEISPFAKFGACSILFFSTPASMLANEIDTLLYDHKAISRMKRRQAMLYTQGEQEVFREAMRVIHK